MPKVFNTAAICIPQEHYMVNLDSKYYIDEKIVKIPYREWYKQKKHLKYAEELRNNIEIERDYSPYLDVVHANEAYLNNLVYEAEQYIADIIKE